MKSGWDANLEGEVGGLEYSEKAACAHAVAHSIEEVNMESVCFIGHEGNSLQCSFGISLRQTKSVQSRPLIESTNSR